MRDRSLISVSVSTHVIFRYHLPLKIFCIIMKQERGNRIQGWASTLASRSNARHRSKTRPSNRKEWKIVLFWKIEGKHCALCRDRCRSRCLGIDFYTFNVKNIVPSTPTFPKVVSITLPIKPFFKFKIWNFCKCWCPPLLPTLRARSPSHKSEW